MTYIPGGAVTVVATAVDYSPTNPTDWTDPDPSNVGAGLDKLAARPAGGFSGDAGDVPYVPAAGADWTDPDPTTVEGALDKLAARPSGGFSGDAGDVPYTPIDGTKWTDPDPITVEDALNKLAAQPSGGSSAVPDGYVWSPYIPPSSPSVKDDEFEGNSLDAKWSIFDPPSHLTTVVNQHTLWMTHAVVLGDEPLGIYQALPSGSFTIETRLALGGFYHPFHRAALAFWNDTPGPDTNIMLWGLLQSSLGMPSPEHKLLISNLWNYHTFNNEPNGYDVFSRSSVLTRVIRNSSSGDWYFEWSEDGFLWQRSLTLNNPINATHVGLIVDHITDDPNLAVGQFDFFRYTNSVLTAQQSIGGGFASVYSAASSGPSGGGSVDLLQVSLYAQVFG